MKRILGFFCVILLALNVHSQAVSTKRTHFAVGLFASSYSQLITYAILTTRDGVITGAQVVSEERFMYEAMGYYPSIANIRKENIFQKNGVDSCFLFRNESNKIVGYYAKPFVDLWRIRFFTHPYLFDTDGWSQGQFKPSRWQMEYLQQEYGVNNVLTDYFYGDSLFKLLRDIQNPEWVYNYHFIPPDTTASSANQGQP